MYQIFERLIQEQGLSSYRVAKMAGIGEYVLSDWKRGKSTPNSENMAKIADVLGVSSEYLLGKNEKPRAYDDTELEKRIEAIVISKLDPTKWSDEQAQENIQLFQALPKEKKQEALRYLRYLAGNKDN